MFLRNGFQAVGGVSLRGAAVGEDVVLIGGAISGGGDVALDLVSCRVGDRIMLRQPNRTLAEQAWPATRIDGLVDLRNARCATLVDNALETTPSGFRLRLDGFSYGAIVDGPATAAARLPWLARQDARDMGAEFKPQPYEQLAKLLRETGHEADAKRVQIAKRVRLRRAAFLRTLRGAWPTADPLSLRARAARLALAPLTLLGAALRFVMDALFHSLLGYGYRPFNVLVPAAFALIAGFYVFSAAEKAGVMVPNSAYILRSPEWIAAQKTCPDAPARCWLKSDAAKRYPSFSPFVYSLDLFLPIFDLHQESNWIPQPKADEKRWLYKNARLWMWLEIGFGYLLTALAIAGFTGIVKQE